MAEAFGIVVNALAIVQLTGKLISFGYEYMSSVKHAPKNLRELVDELHSLGQVLMTVKDHADDDPRLAALHMLNDQNGPLEKCAAELTRLQNELEPGKGMKGKWQNLKWPLKESDTLKHIARIGRYRSLFEFALTADHMALSKAIKIYVQETNSVVQDIQTESINLSKEIKTNILAVQRIETHVRETNTAMKAEHSIQDSLRQKEYAFNLAEKRKKILNWLYSGSANIKHLEIRNSRQDGTGGWLLRSPEFKSWIERDLGSRLLWGYGIPGSGKTFLSSTVIDDIELRAPSANYGVAYIYFDYIERDQLRPIDVLASLIKQLTCQAQPKDFPLELQKAYDLELCEMSLSIEKLYTILLAISKSFTHVFFVFDALDECYQNQRRLLLPLIHRMTTPDNDISLFVTSRQHPEDIQTFFQGVAKIELLAKEEDIITYIEQKLDENPRSKRLVQQSKCKDKIVSDLVDCAKGMFLLVRFHIDYLCQQTTVRRIMAELEKLKSSSTGERPLDPTYDRAMETLRSQPRGCMELALVVLSWLCKARRTLTVEELQEAVSVEPNRYEIDKWDLPDRATLIDICASLVIIDERTNSIRLAHYTVQQYLLENHIIPDDADLRLAITCITYASFDEFAEGPCTSHECRARIELNPFYGYAAVYLGSHIRDCDENLSLDYVLMFLEKKGCVSSFKQARGFIREELDGFEGAEPLLNIACSLGHLKAVQRLLDQGADIFGADFRGFTALHQAALEGHENIVRFLLESGAEVSCWFGSCRGCTPLLVAVLYNQQAVVKLLLESGAEVSVKLHDGSTVLHIAAIQGNKAIVQQLLDKGGNISSKHTDGRTPLHEAVLVGNEDVIKQLLENCDDVSVQDFSGSTALHLAVSPGRETVVQQILEKGINVSVQNSSGITALDIVAFLGHEEVVQKILASGNSADVSSQDSNGYKALHLAVLNGHEKAVQKLLENGINVSSQYSIGNTALHLAAFKGHEKIVQKLLENGADASARCSNGLTAVHLAALGGHEKVVQRLLEKGANIQSQDWRGQIALYYAAQGGHGAAVQKLLDSSSDVPGQDITGFVPLHKRPAGGHEVVVQQLLNHGANFLAKRTSGVTPLRLAAYVGDETVVQILKYHANDWAQKHDRKTYLMDEFVRINLIEYGTNILARCDGWTSAGFVIGAMK